MRTKKQYINTGLISLVILFIIVFSSLFLKENNKTEAPETKIEVNDSSIIKSSPEIKIKTPIDSTSLKEKITIDNKKYILITLNVFDKNYSVKTEEGSSVYDAMKNIKDDTFSFSGVEHSGLGFFVNEINGVMGTPGKYWIYYVNDKEASVGASNYILKDGDTISWKQE